MKLTAVDLEHEDYYTINRRDPLKYSLTKDDSRLSHSVHGVIKYDYIDLGKTDYHFKQAFEQQEISMYFERMNLLSTTTIDNLSSRADDLHLRRSDIKGNLKKAVLQIYPEMAQSNPIIYHIALHDKNHKEKGDRNKGTRCPRLYFMLGTNGHIYILFFDPYHELNPMIKADSRD
ncbi:MAG: hypothetical protein K2L92_10720 [Muribaculaceae bacterium]|nr:hypothetical protein [Muribaculaceae bacterium]MDE6565288.1 hypothetical protein [Muribaculaceae bacterium]